MTVIDAWFAKSLGTSLQTSSKRISIRGIRSRHVSTDFVNIALYFCDQDNAAKITVEAHIVDELKASLLLGVDVMGCEGFRLDFGPKAAIYLHTWA